MLEICDSCDLARGRRSVKDRIVQVTGLLAVQITEGVVWVLISALVVFAMATAAGRISVLYN